ncbi:MAG: family 16 glycoside hydrolase [Chryseolinea sp.]
MYILKRCFVISVAVFSVTLLHGQDKSAKSFTLTDMSEFKSQAGNWQVVGDVTIDPTTEIHPHEEASLTQETRKKGKKSKAAEVVVTPQPVTFKAGKGILLNMNDGVKKDNLVSNFEHGDIELEFEVMLPKGSNSGVYLQGRYEVQLLDSWGIKHPSFSDIGGIYRNWEKEAGKIYMGKAPLTNPAKAPGLWQKFKISFRAPRFNSAGEKISNAKFVSVELNGVKIHDNVEVPLPTGGPLENNEKAMGPLMIQGDHGPVALRNITYRLLREIKFTLSDITYKTFYGNFKLIGDFASMKPAASGSIPELTCEVLSNEDSYGSSYTGNIHVPEDGTYQFTLAFTGGGRLTINNEQLINIQKPDASEQAKSFITLKSGTYPFEIYNYKDASWMPPRLGLSVQSETTYPQTLNAFNSYPPDDDPTSPIYVGVGSEPRLLRAFVDFKDDYKQRLTHTIGVGDPSGTHYVYDLKSGNLVCLWHGSFVDATYMWHDRGDGSFKPRGAVQFLFNNQPLAFLASDKDPFPLITKEQLVVAAEHKGKGYEMDTAGRPTFKYSYQGLDVEDKIYPSDQDRAITHEVNIKNRGGKTGLYYKLGEGQDIVQVKNGLYAIDDKQYYIQITGATPIVRGVNGKKELVVPVDSQVKYSIIW